MAKSIHFWQTISKRPNGNHGNDQKYSRNDIPNVTSPFLLVFSTVEAA